jgi:glycosyltransferase involved in cell wall biosynthesis
MSGSDFRSNFADSVGELARVLIVTNFYSPYVVGGAEVVASHLASWLVRQGIDVTVVSTCGPEEAHSSEMLDGVRVLRYFPPNLWWNFERFAAGDHRSMLDKARWNLRDIWNRRAAVLFGDLLDAHKPDIVHTHNLKGFSPAIWAEITRRRIPLVHTAHDYYLVCQRGTLSRGNGRPCTRRCGDCSVAALSRKTLGPLPDVFCSPSEWVLARHLAFGVHGKAESSVVPNGIVRLRKSGPQSRRTKRGGPLHLLYLGQIREEKGAHLLFPALSMFGDQVSLSIAGEGPLSPKIAAWADRDSRVTWHGFVRGEQKERLLADADVLLFPSMWSENAPLVIGEAMGHALPVIASDMGAIPEFIQHEQNGLLFASGDPVAMAGAVRRLLEDRTLLESLSVNAASAAERWSVDHMGRRYLEIYRRVTGAPSVQAVEILT